MFRSSARSSRRWNWIPAALIFMISGILFGLIGALGGWFAQAVLLSVLLPIILLLLNYRIAIYASIILLPFANSSLIPKVGPFSLTNVLLLGTVLAFLARLTLAHLKGRYVMIPVSRELMTLYVLPITLGALIGSFYLDEIPRAFLALNNFESYGLWTYWISLYFKQMLYVAIAVIIGASLIERNHGLAIPIATLSSGLLFGVGIFLTIALSGVGLDLLRHDRDFLSVLGTHNNTAGSLLLMPFAVALFMREYVKGVLWRLALLISSLILCVSILLTFSRGAFLGMLAIGSFYIWHFKRIKLTFSAVAVLIVSLALAPDAIRERLLTGLDGGASVAEQLRDTDGTEELTAGRIFIWNQRLSDLWRSPIWGSGIKSGQWSDLVKSGYNYLDDTHNIYLAILTDLGFVGMLFMILFYRYLWRLFMGLANDDRIESPMRGFFFAALAVLFSIPITGIAGGDYMPGLSGWLLWVAIGTALGYQWVLTLAAAKESVGTSLDDNKGRGLGNDVVAWTASSR